MKYSDFKHMSVPGDGSCFFHSVAQILLLEDLEFTDTQRARLAKSLRKECVRPTSLYFCLLKEV